MPNTSNCNSCENSSDDSAPLEQLLSGLPLPIGRTFAWMRRPETRWARIPAASVLVIGGLLGFLPILGFWMLPFGAVQGWYDRRRGTARARP